MRACCLDAGSAVHLTGKGATPLYFAVAHANNHALAQLLLDRGADPHEGISLLHSSCDFHFEFLTDGLHWLISTAPIPIAPMNTAKPACTKRRSADM